MKKKRILAVDDDPTALNALRQILTQKGYDVLTAPDGEAGLELLETELVDLALLDVSLPGMSGYDLCRAIRRDPRIQDIPVVFLTARGLVLDMTEGEAAGSDLYLIKPVLATKLVNMVGMFLSSDAPLSRKRRASVT
jgi:two-component system phosphate regulon response regulator PhoB